MNSFRGLLRIQLFLWLPYSWLLLRILISLTASLCTQSFGIMNESRQERYHFFNSLAILLKAVENERTTVDLRNEASVRGIIEHADAFMNIVMKDCVLTDPRGDSYSYDMLFVQARNIRFVHIPPKIRIIPAIKEQLQHLLKPKATPAQTKKTSKAKRAIQRQQEGLAAVAKILRDRQQAEHNYSKSNTDEKSDNK